VSAHGWADLRGPTACEVITEGEQSAVVAKLGPDPLQAEAGPDEFVQRLTSKGSAVGTLLMSQDVIAGVGNIYRAETLFRRGLNPWRPGKSLSGEEAALLWEDIALVMRDGFRDGRIITTRAEHRDGKGLPVWPDNAHYVYQRQGLGCRVCGTDVVLAEMGNRKLYWCPGCQQP
jgi:endonuclease-8/formamidopyrimidine-DNA glycosylase